MKFILQTTKKISFSALILGLCLFSAQTAFSQRTWDAGGGADKAWSTAANWSGDVVPTATDDVTIIEGADVIVTTAATAVCRKLIVNGSTSVGQGKVTINTMATLTATATDNVNVPIGATNAALILFGGIIDNKGTLTINGRQSLDALRFDNPTSGTLSSTYMGTGTLNCNTTNGNGGGGSGNTGASMSFQQASGTAIFTSSSLATYSFNVFITSATAGTKSVFYCPKGTAKIDGNAEITIGGGRRAVRIIPNGANETPNFTIESGITLNISTTLTTVSIGMILLDPSTIVASASMTNKGTLNFSGDIGNPIYMINTASATNTTNFTNEGTININGTFADATATVGPPAVAVTQGGIAMFGANTTLGNVFTNSGSINFNTTSGGTSPKPLFICSTSPKNLVTNSGTITVGANGTPAIAIRLGNAQTIMNNTGTVTVGAGSISGNTTNANFNNNTGGILNLNSGVNSSLVLFTNAGGTFNVPLSQTLGRLTVNGGTVAVADGASLTMFALILTSGHITLGTTGTGNVVISGVGSSVTGGSLTSHIITNGTGKLTQQNVTALGAVFPIGQSAMSYDPVVIKPTAASSNFGARVGLQTTALGTNPVNPSSVVDREWDITGTGTTDLAFTSSALNKDGSTTRPTGSVGTIGHYNTATSTWDAGIVATYASNTWGIAAYTGGFSPFIVASPDAVLSAEMTNFKATPLSKINLLTWETASETNNKGFDVQRKTATGAWETLGFVQGTGKATTYTFEDKGPLSISYYRLRQIDFDGKETLSKVISVSQNTKGRISISPNPTSDKVNIQLNQNDASNATATVILSDMTGRQVWAQITTSNVLQLDLSNLAKGMYVVTVQSNNAVYQEKIIRQ